MADAELKVVWADIAAKDLEEIVSYIALESPANAKAVLKRLRNQAEALSSMARRGRVVPELRDLSPEPWREILLRPYRIIYRISGQQILILAVLDGRRDLEDLLLRRLLRT